MGYDKNKIKQLADPVKVALHIGYRWNVDIRQNGSVTQIICPSHQRILGRTDSNFGSCSITKSGTKCFACAGGDPDSGGRDDVFQMVVDRTGCSFKEAVEIVAETVPDAYLYYTDNTLTPEQLKEKKFSAIDENLMSLIGLDEGKGIISAKQPVDGNVFRQNEFPVYPFFSKEEAEDLKSFDEHVAVESSIPTDIDNPIAPFVLYENKDYSLDVFKKEHPGEYTRMVARKMEEKFWKIKELEKQASMITDSKIGKDIKSRLASDRKSLLAVQN